MIRQWHMAAYFFEISAFQKPQTTEKGVLKWLLKILPITKR
jgi:hypothetical protein